MKELPRIEITNELQQYILLRQMVEKALEGLQQIEEAGLIGRARQIAIETRLHISTTYNMMNFNDERKRQDGN